MSRKVRDTKKNFKVFCEGDTEFNYLDEMRRKSKFSITLKPINMKGGGYSNFLDILKTDGRANCLAKFIIVDGDRAINQVGEKKNLQELINYCILQNQCRRTPHILIINYPDFEYIGCLHTPQYRGQDVEQYIISKLKYKSIDQFKADNRIYSVLNTKGNSSEHMLLSLNNKNCFVINKYAVIKSLYTIKVDTTYDWNKLGIRGSNINEYFEILNYFNSPVNSSHDKKTDNL